jgi:hypothetical protein
MTFYNTDPRRHSRLLTHLDTNRLGTLFNDDPGIKNCVDFEGSNPAGAGCFTLQCLHFIHCSAHIVEIAVLFLDILRSMLLCTYIYPFEENKNNKQLCQPISICIYAHMYNKKILTYICTYLHWESRHCVNH